MFTYASTNNQAGGLPFEVGENVKPWSQRLPDRLRGKLVRIVCMAIPIRLEMRSTKAESLNRG